VQAVLAWLAEVTADSGPRHPVISRIVENLDEHIPQCTDALRSTEA
jgi:hypothetical protein